MVLLVVVLGMLGTATKLATARKIALTGAVSGNTNFDGSGDITITTKQANIAVLTGTISLTSGVGQQSINYPSGFTKDNCVAISSNIQYTSNWSPDGNHVILGSNTVILNSSTNGPTGNKNYRIVLMKIA